RVNVCEGIVCLVHYEKQHKESKEHDLYCNDDRNDIPFPYEHAAKVKESSCHREPNERAPQCTPAFFCKPVVVSSKWQPRYWHCYHQVKCGKEGHPLPR